jgi:hypothetical protein
MPRRSGILLVLPVIAAFATLPALGREGFGFTKRAVKMSLTRPPAINVIGARLRVKATSVRSDDVSDAESLQKLAEDAITAGDPRIAASSSPDLDVRLSLSRLDAGDTWETKTEEEYKQTGTKDEWNASKGKYERKAVYGNVPVTKRFKNVQGNVEGTFEIRDGKGHVLDRGTFDRELQRKYEGGENAPTREQVMDDLLHQAAGVVAARIVPTADRVAVLVPKGSFENFIPLAESGKWEDYLAAVSAVPEMRSRDQEAYRQYALAVAKEGLAYATTDRIRAAKLLDEALTHYRNAADFNSEESLFREAHTSLFGTDVAAPLPRVEASARAYQRWATGTPPAVKSASLPSSASGSGRKGTAIDNQSVIDMAHAGLTDENIKLAIDAAAALDFDTRPEGLIALSKAGVSKPVIAYMQKRTKSR